MDLGWTSGKCLIELTQGPAVLEAFPECLNTPRWTSRVTPQWPEIMCLGSLRIMLPTRQQRRGSAYTHYTQKHTHYYLLLIATWPWTTLNIRGS